MPQKPKKGKPRRASDGLIKPKFIEEAQHDTIHFGVSRMFKAIRVVEPELVTYIAAVADDLAAHAMLDSEMPRPAAMQLRERIIAMGLNVFQAQHHAVYTYYQDLIAKTPAAALDQEPFPKLPPKDEEEDDDVGE